MIRAKDQYLKGVRLSERFYDDLRAIDPKCDAILDPYHKDERVQNSVLVLPKGCSTTGAIHVVSERVPGVKVHEITVARRIGEATSLLERRTIVKLRECDVWKRFGKDGNKYDDHIDQSDRKLKEKLEKEAHDKRVGELLDEEGDVLRKTQKELSRMVGVGANRR